MEKIMQGIIRGNTVLLENNENLAIFDGRRVLLTLLSDSDGETSFEDLAESRLRYLDELRNRSRRSSDRDADEINRSIRELRDNDRF